MNLLVTGGAGFIGSNFIRQTLAAGADLPWNRVVNLDKLSYAGNLANLRAVEGHSAYRFRQVDLCEAEAVRALFEEEKITTVVHFAAESHVDRSIDSPEPFLRTNIFGTFNLLEAARHAWLKREAAERARFRFLHVSTDEVYGSLRPQDPAFSETTPYAPNSPYAASKASSDQIVRAYFHTYGLPVVTTNCSNNYGPYQFPEKLLPVMILNALEEKPLPIYGDGSNIRDWLYVEDHCRAIRLVLDKGRLGETYNIGGATEMTNLQIVDTLCALLDDLRPRAGGKRYAELKTFVKDRPGHDRRYAIDFRKLQNELGWSPQETLPTGLRRTAEWYLANRAWCDDITSGNYQRERLGLGV